MRYYEFIMEYKTQITKGNYGQKILDKIGLPTIVQRKHIPLGMVENDYTLGALDLMGVIELIDGSGVGQQYDGNLQQLVSKITPEDYEQHKGGIIDWMLRQFESFDPTPNKQYTQQIVKWFLSDNLAAFPNIEDGISTLKQSLYSFAKMKARLPEDLRDIAQYTSVKNFMASVQHYRDVYGKPDDLPKGDSQTIYEKDGVVARWAKDQEAACYLGQGTQWCTAATQSNNMFNHYNDRGALIVVQLAEPIRFYGEPEYEQYDPSQESWDDVVERIKIEVGEDVLEDINAGFLKWIKDNKLEDYDEDLIDELVTDRKEDENEIEEFIDSNGGPTSEAIDRYKKDFRHNNPEEYENRMEDGHDYMDWVREYVKDYMEDEFTDWLINDIRANKEVEGQAMALAQEDLTIGDWANDAYMDGYTGLLYDYDIELEGPENEDQDSLNASKLQMHIVSTKDGFKVETMTNEEDIEIPSSELSTPEDGETALSKAWRNQGPDSLQDAIRRISEAKGTNNL